MSFEIVIVRHGQTDYNLTNTIQGQTDIPLNAAGIFQADLAAKRLAKEEFTCVYSSDLSRALVTAESIAPGKEIIKDSRLREWLLGDWQGMTLKEIENIYPGGFRAFLNNGEKAKAPNGESGHDVTMRVKEFLLELPERHKEGKILIVSHGGAIRRMFHILMGEQNSFAELPQSDNTSISRFLYREDHWRMISWNDTGHLAGMELLGTRY